VATVLLALACQGSPPQDATRIGLLLSYTGNLAASSVNSERAVFMAIEAANGAGGVAGRPLEVIARNSGSDPTAAGVAARALLDAGVEILIGPDTPDQAAQLKTLWGDRAIILPSFNTSSDIIYRPSSWFVMGPATARVACELLTQLRNDGRTHPVAIVNPGNGYNSALTWQVIKQFGMPKITLSTDVQSNADSVAQIISEAPDAYVLAALPASASSLVYALTAKRALADPTRWYLSPTLHTPAFLESLPRRSLDGAHGVSAGAAAGSADFRAAFHARWQDAPLDDAYSFYDAAAVTVLALGRAAQRGAATSGTGLADQLRAVTRAGNTTIRWNELVLGLTLIAQGEEVEYVGLSGPIQFDASGQTPEPSTRWWTVGQGGFQDVAANSACR
jgi:ABC-type branched-subunit amino acid transport system substrate-binding protein